MANSTEKLLQSNIKKYRTKKGYSQAQLGIITGISPDYLSEIERGKKIPSIKRLILISKALNIEVYKFFV